MATALFGIAFMGLIGACLAFLMFHIARAPLGYEDENGFNFGEPPFPPEINRARPTRHAPETEQAEGEAA